MPPRSIVKLAYAELTRTHFYIFMDDDGWYVVEGHAWFFSRSRETLIIAESCLHCHARRLRIQTSHPRVWYAGTSKDCQNHYYSWDVTLTSSQGVWNTMEALSAGSSKISTLIPWYRLRACKTNRNIECGPSQGLNFVTLAPSQSM